MALASLLTARTSAGELPAIPDEDHIKKAGDDAGELLKQVRDAKEKALKAALEKAKRDAARRKEKQKDKPSEGSDIELLAGGPRPIVRVDADAQRDLKRINKGETVVYYGEPPDTRKRNLYQVDESGKIRPWEAPEGTQALDLPDQKDWRSPAALQASQGGTPKKRSFWDRLLGRNKEEDAFPPPRVVRDDGGVPAGLGGEAAAAAPKASLRSRVNAELAAKRLAAGDTAPAGAVSAAPTRAAVVDLEFNTPPDSFSGAPPAASPSRDREGAAGTPLADARGSDAPPASPRELRAQAERRFLAGLASRDLLERDWAFRYAAAYRREEALPALIQEVRSDGTLAQLAATALGLVAQSAPLEPPSAGAAGKSAPETARTPVARAASPYVTYLHQQDAGATSPGVAEKSTREAAAALITALASRLATVRQAAAEALGALEAPEAGRPLQKLLKSEKNHLVRAACCEALGLLHDRDALGLLREKLASNDEGELVRVQAALALARLGERAGEQCLEANFAAPVPVLQVLGLAGLCALNGPQLPEYLATALLSPYDEAWLLAVRTFPQLGPARAVPVLRMALQSELPAVQHRAALALGLLGVTDGLPYIEQALLQGGLAERQLAAELLGLLAHRGAIPLLIERLRDPYSAVRKAAAAALVRLEAKEALPALVQAARGPRGDPALALSRGALPDVEEMLVLLGAIRILHGDEGTLAFHSLPDLKNTRWPEYDREVSKYQLEIIRAYRVVEVMGAPAKPVAAVLRDPQGGEQLYREGEMVAAGYRVRDLHVASGPDRTKDADWVTLVRGETRITLIAGREAQVQTGRGKKEADGK